MREINLKPSTALYLKTYNLSVPVGAVKVAISGGLSAYQGSEIKQSRRSMCPACVKGQPSGMSAVHTAEVSGWERTAEAKYSTPAATKQ
jgi:hypothetical protein